MLALCWATSLKTAPASEPLTLTEAKLHLRIPESVTDEDDLIRGLIAAAREHVETLTNRALITQTWYWKAEGFPGGSRIVLPRPPLVSITSVSYVDQNGDTQTWAAGITGYQLVKPAGPRAAYASIWPSYGQYYPQTRTQPEAVTVEYVCGYGDGDDVPESIKHAMKLLIGHWYENREAVDLEADAKPVPIAVDALLAGFAVDRWV